MNTKNNGLLMMVLAVILVYCYSNGFTIQTYSEILQNTEDYKTFPTFRCDNILL